MEDIIENIIILSIELNSIESIEDIDNENHIFQTKIY